MFPKNGVVNNGGNGLTSGSGNGNADVDAMAPSAGAGGADSDSADDDMEAFGKKKKPKKNLNGPSSIKNAGSKRSMIAAGTGLKAANSLNNGNLRASSMGSGNITPS